MPEPYYEPEFAASSYLYDNIKEALTDQGYIIELYVPSPSRNISKEARKTYRKIRYEEKHNGRLRIHRFTMYSEGKNTFLRSVRYFFCSIAHLWYGLTKNFDILYLGSTPPITGVTGAIIKSFRRKPIVQVIQDVFPDSLLRVGLTEKDSIIWKIGRRLENISYRNAEIIIVISEEFKQNIINKGVPKDKIVVINNWVDENVVFPIKREDNPIFYDLGLDKDYFYVVYAGNLGNSQNIEIILDTAAELIAFEKIRFIIFGSGTNEVKYTNMARELKLNNLQFFPLQPYEKVSQVYSLGDVSIVTCRAGCGGSAMPSKTWSVMAAGTALIASFDEGSELQLIIEKNALGIFAKAGDQPALKSCILKLYLDKKLCEELGKNGREFIMKNRTREIGTSKYVDVLKKIESQFFAE